MSKITKTLETVEVGKTFEIGGVEFIKFSGGADGQTIAVAKDIAFYSEFGKNNNFAQSYVLNKLTKEFFPKIADAVGEENVCEIETDLTTLDGLKTYGTMKSKVSLPTFDFYRANVEIFDRYKLDNWWWLATPDSAAPHYEDNPWVLCVAPSGNIDFNDHYDDSCNSIGGVRPFLIFVSTISVSCEE